MLETLLTLAALFMAIAIVLNCRVPVRTRSTAKRAIKPHTVEFTGWDDIEFAREK